MRVAVNEQGEVTLVLSRDEREISLEILGSLSGDEEAQAALRAAMDVVLQSFIEKSPQLVLDYSNMVQ